MKIRLISRLEIKGRSVVKGIRMEGLRVVGTPGDLMEKYFRGGIDEIIFIDTVASLYGRNNLSEIVSMAADYIFVPLTVGGGVRSMDDFYRLLRAGADKVSINTHAFSEPELITQAAKAFGSQCVVVSIQAKHKEGRFEPFTDNGRQRTHRDAVEWVREVVDRGCGEILLTSVDRDGTCHGLDHDLIKAVADAVNVPVIAAGGSRDTADIAQAVLKDGASAVAVSHLLHFGKTDVATLKTELAAAGISVRMDPRLHDALAGLSQGGRQA